MRRQRIEKLLFQVVASYFQQQAPFFDYQLFASISQVSVTPALDLAKVYISFWEEMSKDKSAAILAEVMEQHQVRLKKTVAVQLRHQLRRVPAEIRFYLDESPARTEKLTRLMSSFKS